MTSGFDRACAFFQNVTGLIPEPVHLPIGTHILGFGGLDVEVIARRRSPVIQRALVVIGLNYREEDWRG